MLSVEPSEIRVNGLATVRATVLSIHGYPIPGINVSFGTTAGIITPAISTTDENGTAIATLSAPTEAGTAIVTVYVVNYPNVNNSTTVEFVPAEYTDAIVYADPEAIPADGKSTTTIIVELLDKYGNLVPRNGVQVYLTTTAGTFENGEQSISGVTKNGRFTAILKSSTEPTVAVITANIAGVGEKRTTVKFFAPAEIRLKLSKGWQMISIPLKPPIRCDKYLIAYTWDPVNKTYVRVDEFEPGKGYWVYAREEMTVTFTGSEFLYEYNVSLTKGWNMIGTIMGEVYLPTVIEEYKLEKELKVAYTWDPVNKRYRGTEMLEPGKGYWVYAPNNTTLPLTVTPPPHPLP